MELGELIGKGRTAELYRVGNGNVVKLFHESYAHDAIEREYKTSMTITETRLSVPRVIEKIQLNDRLGIVYEFIEGKTMLETMQVKPLTFVSLARQLAEEHARIHLCTAEHLPLQRPILRKSIERAKLPQQLTQKVLSAASNLPDGEMLCHGDFHPDNIILGSHRAVIIDWNDATIGHPLADVARTSLILTTAAAPSTGLSQVIFGCYRRVFHDAYLSHYVQLTGSSRSEIEQWRIPIAAARIAENVPGERQNLLRIVEQWASIERV